MRAHLRKQSVKCVMNEREIITYWGCDAHWARLKQMDTLQSMLFLILVKGNEQYIFHF